LFFLNQNKPELVTSKSPTRAQPIPMPALAPVERPGLLELWEEVLGKAREVLVEDDVELDEVCVSGEETEEEGAIVEDELAEGRTMNAGLESTFAVSSNATIEAL
jgi:hypothetical protein